MILISLSLQNFKQYKKAEISFREGLIGIIGKNGSGKSTLFDAIMLGLFGDIPGNKEYLRYQKAGEKDAVAVILTLLLDSKEYEVKREFRGKNLTAQAELSCNGAQIASGQKEVTAEITRLIGMAKDSFSRSIFAGQKELGLLSELGGADRKEFIRKILGVTKIDEIQKSIRDDARTIKNEISGQKSFLLSDSDISAKKEKVNSLSDSCYILETGAKALEKKVAKSTLSLKNRKDIFFAEQIKKDAHSKLENKQASLAAQEESLKNQISSNKIKQAEIRSLETEFIKLEESENIYKTLKNQIDVFEKQNVLYIKAEHLKEDLSGQTEALHSILTELKSNGILVSEAEPIELLLEQGKAEQKKYEKAKKEADAKLNALRSKLGSIKNLFIERQESKQSIVKHGADSDCPTCLRPLKDSYTVTLHKLDSEIEKYSKEIKSLETAEKELIKETDTFEENEIRSRKKNEYMNIQKTGINQTREKINQVKTRLTAIGNIEFEPEKYRLAKKEFEERQKTHDRFISVIARKKELPILEKEYTELQSALEKNTVQGIEIKKAAAELGFSQNFFDKASADMQEAQNKKDDLTAEFSRSRESLLSTQHELSAIKKELAENEQRQKTIEKQGKEQILLDKLVILMDKFKTAILSQIQPAIAHYASSMFTRLTLGRYESIHIDEDFNFLIFDEGNYFPIDRFSGGEKDLANLCLRLALSNTICDLAGAAAPAFLGFDEIFGSQDRERRYGILSALLLLQEQYRQILIISHDEELKDEFPNILEVRRTLDGSTTHWLGK